jgi:peptidoglycan/xylan/chitin deacetylase (PgdA/CDA1 family)
MTHGTLLTTSWDDGGVDDLRVADWLEAHGLTGTFYVPRSSAMGPVLEAAALRDLVARGFEIGAHTLTHRRLPGLSAAELREEVAGGKRWLEDLLGRPVASFAYPGGFHDAASRAAVAEAGFAVARTVAHLAVDCAGADPLRLPVTCQVFPHGRIAHLRQLRGAGNWSGLRRYVADCRCAADPALIVARLMTPAPAMIHLWGHGWELERHGLWALLERMVAAARSRGPVRAVVNRHLADRGS